jgi:hypothetical protein
MGHILLKIVLFGVAVALYMLVYRMLKRRRKDSPVASFSVGGRKRNEQEVAEMDSEERTRKRKVSLRSGSRFKRRF